MVESRLQKHIVKPKDVLNTKIEDLVGSKCIIKRGATEREREETSLTDVCQVSQQLEGVKYLGLLFSAENSPPCKSMLK